MHRFEMRQQFVKKKHKILRLIVKLVENFQCLGRILLVYALCKREQMFRSCDACGSPYGFLVNVGATLIHWSSSETASLIPPSDNLEISLAASSVIFTFFFFVISHSRFVLSSTSNF